MVGIGLGLDVDALVGDDPAFVERVFVRMAEADEFIVALDIRKVEAGDPADRLQRNVPALFELVDQAAQRFLGGRLVEAADLDIDRMDLPATDRRDDLVSSLFMARPRLTISGSSLASSIAP